MSSTVLFISTPGKLTLEIIVFIHCYIHCQPTAVKSQYEHLKKKKYFVYFYVFKLLSYSFVVVTQL